MTSYLIADSKFLYHKWNYQHSVFPIVNVFIPFRIEAFQFSGYIECNLLLDEVRWFCMKEGWNKMNLDEVRRSMTKYDEVRCFGWNQNEVD